MKKTVHHVVTRPARKQGEPDLEIPVADDIASVPGTPLRERDVSFFSREYPLESQTIEKGADRVWIWSVYTKEASEFRKQHDARVKPLVSKANVSGDLPPTGQSESGENITEAIREKALDMGFGEVGFTKFDRRYVFASKKRWAKFEHAICLAYEQDYEKTQSIPSMDAEETHYGTYEIEGKISIDLAAYIRSKGYRAQIHNPSDHSASVIAMFVAAGLGQLGANGQLLSPHFGSRSRLMIITTDAPVVYDKPEDYGINKFCEKCQVCVNRCPGRALVKDKVWWRGVEKNKLIYDRCRPVMARYEGCGVCMKVCPIQKHGMKPVMEHYINTGEILGKGSHDLEG
ncbi:MAG: reductive dehalogenase domain-containing protein, partial [Chloroflexota bacterium]|nr:reductive dehalogenase domain-containing protein [Chloroflexota bacterium]